MPPPKKPDYLFVFLNRLVLFLTRGYVRAVRGNGPKANVTARRRRHSRMTVTVTFHGRVHFFLFLLLIAPLAFF